jgi:epoxyqueuosine reductase
MPAERPSLVAVLKERAKSEGFAACGITGTDQIPDAGRRLYEFLGTGRHGDMDWLAAHANRRSDPRLLWPEARTAIVVARDYAPAYDPLAVLQQPLSAAISCYADGRDYHDTMKPALKRLASWFAQASGADVKVFVDTAPLMEKPLAQAAGLGWQGKHTNLVSRQLGSWFFLGVILSDAELPRDPAEIDHCGSCQRCVDICPTAAFPAPFQLDARRCIAYLTIEHKGHIAPEFRAAIGNRVFGCDDCLAVCPWNKFAAAARDAQASQDNHRAPPLAELLQLDDAAFRDRFRGTPLKRTGRDRFIRNVLIAAGNARDPGLLPAIRDRLLDASPLVRAMAVWALARLSHHDAVQSSAAQCLPQEHDSHVRAEWAAAGCLTTSHAPEETS